MYAHHRQTIENHKACYEHESDCLALVIIGSVARGEARPDSDVDFYYRFLNRPSSGLRDHICNRTAGEAVNRCQCIAHIIEIGHVSHKG